MSSFTLGVVHYASFPEARVKAGAFWRSLERLLLDPLIDVIELSSELPENATASLRGLFATSGKRLFLSAGPRLRDDPGLCSTAPAQRRETVAAIKELIDVAISISASNLMLISGPDPGSEQRSLAYGALLDALAELCEYARSSGEGGLTLTLEPFAREHSPFQLVGPTTEALTLLERLGARHPVRLTADLSHFAQLGEDPVKSVHGLGSGGGHIHLSTCILVPRHPLFGDRHPSFDTPGIALSPLTAARALAAARGSFAGEIVASIEVRPGPGDESDHVWSAARRQLLDIAQMAEHIRADQPPGN
jgi:sugar phosphate isomerase/epimerase